MMAEWLLLGYGGGDKEFCKRISKSTIELFEL